MRRISSLPLLRLYTASRGWPTGCRPVPYRGRHGRARRAAETRQARPPDCRSFASSPRAWHGRRRSGPRRRSRLQLSRHRDPAGSTPPAAGRGYACARRTAARAPGPQDRPGPVLLVPGYGGMHRITGLARQPDPRQRPLCHRPAACPAPAPAACRRRRLAQCRRQPRPARGAPSVDVIGYSAGGVVALIWARRDDGAARATADHHARLAVPWHAAGRAAQAFVPGAVPGCLPAARPGQLPARQPRRSQRGRAAALALALDYRRHRRHAA